jgi:hypothetical protein
MQKGEQFNSLLFNFSVEWFNKTALWMHQLFSLEILFDYNGTEDEFS